jgi:PAS domain S-box-containing protein
MSNNETKIDDNQSSKQQIKEITKQLHEGKNPEELKIKFARILRDVDPAAIAQVEQELIDEGMSRDEIRKLCDVHLLLFKESFGKQKLQVKEGHPIHTFLEEHKIIQVTLTKLKESISKVKVAKNFEEVAFQLEEIKSISEHLMEVEKHNIREENVLFPYLEKHNITEPPSIMWTEHNELKEKKLQLVKLVSSPKSLNFKDLINQLVGIGDYLVKALSDHIHKENNILYPAALQAIGDDEWKEIKRQCDKLGYCCFTPKVYDKMVSKKSSNRVSSEDLISLETGNLSQEEIEGILNTIPIDVTFVDVAGSVRYFNKAKERVFPRTKAIIGRKVQNCHPPKSVHVVNKVIEDLRGGRRGSADFWLDMNNRKIYIRYFPVKNNKGEYIGILEATQDITDIKKIEGERRLLDETH